MSVAVIGRLAALRQVFAAVVRDIELIQYERQRGCQIALSARIAWFPCNGCADCEAAVEEWRQSDG